MNAAPIRVAVQSTRRLVRDALAVSLAGDPDFSVVSTTAHCGDLLEVCALRRPGALLVDANGPAAEWTGTVAALVGRDLAPNVVVAYESLTATEMARAYRAGVSTLVPYSRGLATVLAALKIAPPAELRRVRVTLTDRELEIVALVGEGHSVRELAAMLSISPRTVENHKRRIYAKLGVRSQSHAIAHAAQLGLLQRLGTPPTCPRTPPVAGQLPYVLVRGPASPARDGVGAALGMSSMIHAVASDVMPDSGPRVGVLVDPEPADWRFMNGRGVPVVLVHSEPLTDSALADAVLKGADAVLAADRVSEDLPSVLPLVAVGYLAVDAARLRALLRGLWAAHPGQGLPSLIPELTTREHEILCSISRGDTVRQTARSLGVSVKTVENTQGRLFCKLGVRNRAGALMVAYGLGLLEPVCPDGRVGQPTA